MSTTPHILANGPLTQDWSNLGLIITNDDWSLVPSIEGYRGDDLTATTAVDPQTVLADGSTTALDVNANQSDPVTFTSGGVTEFELADPTIALAGSGTADAPFIQIYLDTRGITQAYITYNLRDIDGSADDALQQVALQYRIGSTGNFINIAGGYVADASEAGTATKVTAVALQLPTEVMDQSLVQLRIITTNASGNDEAIGIDDLVISSGSLAVDDTGLDLANYVRIGRYDLPVPGRTANPPLASELALEVSAITYNPDTDTLFVLGDEGTAIAEINKQGQLVSSMTLNAGDFADTEGLTYVGNGQFVLVEERLRQANLFTYTAGATLSRGNVQTVDLGTDVGNIGLEGVSFDAATGGFIFVKETGPQGIFQTSLDFATGTASNGSPTTENSTNLFDPALLGLTDIADVFALKDSNNLLVLGQEDGKLVAVDRAGNILSTLMITADADNPLSVSNQGFEGVTLDNNGLLYLTSESGGGDGEHPQMWIYAPVGYSFDNGAPVAVSVANGVTSLLENVDTTAAIKLGNIIISDDSLGTNTLSVSDTTNFEIVGNELFLKAGTVLDFATQSSYTVTIAVDDGTVGSSPDASTVFSLDITDTAGISDLIISEIAPWSSGDSSLGADWFEVTNQGTTAIDISGWKIDDDSASFANASNLGGVTTIAPGQSVVFVDGDASMIAAFIELWFGGTAPQGLAIGTYGGPGLGTGGDGVNLFDATGTLVTGVTFGSAPAASPFATFDNALGNSSVTTLSIVGTNGAFSVIDGGVGAILTASPGAISGTPTTTTTIGIVATIATGSENGPTAGEFTILRTGSTDNPLDVTYLISGDGANGTDYTAIPTTVTIPVGASQVTILISPIDDAEVEIGEPVILTLTDTADYEIQSGVETATVNIEDNDTVLPDFNLQVTEIWPGNGAGSDLTADWFEITNIGTEAWVSGVAPDLYYDDDSQDPSVADLINGLTQLDPGEAAIVVIGVAADAQTFKTVWGPVLDLTNVEIGFTDGAGLGAGGDGVSLFVGLPGATDTPADFETYPDTAANLGQSYDVNLAAFSVAGENGAVATAVNDANEAAIASPGNGSPILKIHTLQGSGDASPLVGQTVTLEAIVVGDFQDGDGDTSRNLRGFYIQEEDGEVDGNGATSEGIFVFENGNFIVDVQMGDLVQITGTVNEYFGETQIDTVTNISVISTGNALPTAANITLPTTGSTLSQAGIPQPDLEAFEGMLVSFPETLTITEMFNLDRFNEIKLAQGDRPIQFTQNNDPDVAGFAAHRQEVGARTITYDDGLNQQNQLIGNLDGFGPTFTTASNIRMGDTITGLSGVLSYQWAGNSASQATWRVRSTENGANTFTKVNDRQATPEDVGGSLKVTGFNVLNYFTTIDLSGVSTAIGQDPRGADTTEEFERQTNKLVTALLAIDADVLGLVELENDFLPGSAGNAIEYLVNELNTVAGAGTYAWVNPGTQFVGDDAIAVGLIYKPGAVSLVGDVAILNTPAFLDPNGTGQNRNRPAVAQSFQDLATGETFTAVVNHFKSKGADGAVGADLDQNDGQGAWNDTRTKAAQALVDWLNTNPTGVNDSDYLLMGDYNAYAQEDPIQVLANAGYVDLGAQFSGGTATSYVFDGQVGTLDYAFASASLARQVTGATEWGINSDEADALDYNLDFGRDPAIADLNSPIRTSDHDPIIVGLNLENNARFATFNASLNRNNAGDLITDLSTPDNPQAKAIAEIIQRNNPDILLLNEFDYDANGTAADLFRQNYLAVSQNGATPVDYPYVYIAPSNTGVPSGFDLDNNGSIGGGNDAFGFGNFEGQYGMVLFSKYEILTDEVRTFQNFLWKDMPGNLLTEDPTVDDPNTTVNENLNGFYSPEEIGVLRLSSKSHWDIPINIDGEVFHVLAAHPTPPVFDGTEDRNGKRNFDEIRFWTDYVTPGQGGYIYDDAGGTGGLVAGERFVILGDYNADPFDGDAYTNTDGVGAANQFFNTPAIQGSTTDTSITPASAGGPDAAERQGALNATNLGNPAFDTADFGPDTTVANLRVDYALPSYNTTIVGSGVFWPTDEDPLFSLVGDFPFPSSDHRLTYVDLALGDAVVDTLPNGVASGDVDQDSAVLWTRSLVLGDVTFEYATDASFTNILGSVTKTVTDTNLPVKTAIEGLTAGTEYFYRAIDAQGSQEVGRFVTAAAPGTTTGLTFGVSGDWRGEVTPYPAIRNIPDRNLDFFVALGDTVYADDRSPILDKDQAETVADFRLKHQEVYSERFGENFWATARASTSILSSIDDHEVTNDFQGGATADTDARFPETTGLINDTAIFENGLQVYQEYNPLRDEFYDTQGNDLFDSEHKLYRFNTYGNDAAVITLDARSFRDQNLPAPDPTDLNAVATSYATSLLTPDRTLLGDVQLEQLKADLLTADSSGVTWKFIMIPEPIQNILVGVNTDNYEGFAQERAQLLQFIDENNIENVVFVAADIHITSVNNLTYQLGGLESEQKATSIFEVTTGSVAYDAPSGVAFAQGIAALSADPVATQAFYESLPIAPDADDVVNDKDDFVKTGFNGVYTQFPQPFDPIGLNNNLAQAEGLIDAQLLQGDYFVSHSYSWTEFDIDPVTQALTVTTYGIDGYTEEDVDPNNPNNKLDEVLASQPTILSQFQVNPNVAPEVANQRFNLSGESTVGTVVGTISATDANTGHTEQLIYAIEDATGFFTVDATTGQISLANNTGLGAGNQTEFTFVAQVTDPTGLVGTASITVNLTGGSLPIVSGTPGADIFRSGINGFTGVNSLVFTGAGEDEVDTVIGGAETGNNRLFSGSGADALFVNNGDRLNAGSGNDEIDATEAQAYRVAGGLGNDIFYLGQEGRAIGGEGDDQFYVGEGGDNLIAGGAGADQFWLLTDDPTLLVVPNTVVDFTQGTDIIGIANQGANFDALDFGGNTITLNGVTFATLTGFDTSTLTAADFVFA
jgi:hypothetical protein